jgi:hypothetical protein
VVWYRVLENWQSGVDGGWLCFKRWRIRLQWPCMYGHTKVSPLRLWETTSPFSSFFWMEKNSESAVTAFRSVVVAAWGWRWR